MSFGARLAEERKRLGLRQVEFADLVGTDAAKQSLYETGKRELRADYLARLADANVDILYVLTGRRSAAQLLDEGASALASAYLVLPPDTQHALLNLARTMRDQLAGPATLHARRAGYRGEEANQR